MCDLCVFANDRLRLILLYQLLPLVFFCTYCVYLSQSVFVCVLIYMSVGMVSTPTPPFFLNLKSESNPFSGMSVE